MANRSFSPLLPSSLSLSLSWRQPGKDISNSTMALLPTPKREKCSNRGGNERLDYGASAMQGWRPNMEDAHVTLEDLDAGSGTSFFAVYDGHGGPAVAKYCANHLHIELLTNEQFHSNITAALENTFLRMDVMMSDRNAKKELSEYRGDQNQSWKTLPRKLMSGLCLPCVKTPGYRGPVDYGCTACVALIRGNQIIVGNAGDSRCVISRGGQAIELSRDHKPDVPSERHRIQNAGHEVIGAPSGGLARIDNSIAVARAIGDLKYKNTPHLQPQDQAVTAFPEVRTEEITDDTEFLVIACDGIWDNMTSQGVVDFIRPQIDSGDLAGICEHLLDVCLDSDRGWDNMSVILVMFKWPAQGDNTPSAPLPPQEEPEIEITLAPSCAVSAGR